MNATSTNLNDAFDPRIALRAFWVRKRLALCVFLTAAGVSALATMRIKPVYESEASLFVRLGRESAGLDPTATTSEITPIYETREQELISALDVMQSRKLLEAVIGVIGEDVILAPERFVHDTWQTSLANTTWPELNPELMPHSNTLHEFAVEKVYKAVTLEVGRSSSVISVISVASTPELAQAITKTLLEAVRAEQVRLNKTHGLQFFSEQVAMLQQKLENARRAMTLRRKELGVNSVVDERERLNDVLTAMQKEVNDLKPLLAGAIASVKVMMHEVAELPDRTESMDATDMLRKKLHELQLKRTTLLTKFTPRFSGVRDANEEIDLVQQQLSDPGNRNTANPTLRELEVTLAAQRTKVAQATAQIAEYETEVTGVQWQLSRLVDAETDMLALADRETEWSAALERVTVKLEQARVLDELSTQRISNIRVVQPPTFNPVSASAPRSFVLLAGLFIGCVAAVVVPAIVEFAAWYLQMFQPEAGSPKVARASAEAVRNQSGHPERMESSVQNQLQKGPDGAVSEELLPCGG